MAEYLPPVTCVTCRDTHRMALGEREVMCTYCPTPCQQCRSNGNGAYCARTPCRCGCHTAPSDTPATSDNVVILNAHVPTEVREAAKAAYLARREYDAVLVRKVNAMRALSKACKKFAIEPESLIVGDPPLTGVSLVPASHYEERGDG